MPSSDITKLIILPSFPHPFCSVTINVGFAPIFTKHIFTKHTCYLCSISLGLLLQSQVFAQTTPTLLQSDTASISELMNVQLEESQLRKNMDNTQVVSASKNKENVATAPGLMTVIDKHELKAYGGLSLVDVLNRAIGTYIMSSHLLPNNSISMRGDLPSHTTGHVLILIDGRPCRESVFGGVYLPILNAYSIEAIERIEIIRGPGSVLYGTNAYTGVINLVTSQERKTTTRLSAKGGSFGTLATSVSQTIAKGELLVNATGGLLSQKGWNFTATDEEGVTGSMNYGQQNASLILNANYKQFTFRSFFADTKTDMLGEDPLWTQEEEMHALDTRRAFADLGYKHAFSSKWDFTINATYNSFNKEFSGDEGDFNYLCNDGLVEMTHFIRPLPKFNITVGGLSNFLTGAGYNEEEGEQEKFIEPYKELNWASYAVVDYSPVKYVKLIVGGQYNKVGNGVAGHFSPRLGAIVNITHDLGIKALYGEAFRSGSASEKHILVENELYGNPMLKPERVNTKEIQAFFQKPSYQFTASYFNSQQHDEIILATYTTESEIYKNENSLTFQGVELESKVLPIQQLSFTGNFAYQNSKNEEGIRNTTPISNWMIKGGLAYMHKSGLTAGLYNSFFSQPAALISYQADEAGEEQTEMVNPVPQAFHLLSLNFTADINKLFSLKSRTHIAFNAYGQNLLNEKVYNAEFSRRNINSVPAMGGRAFYGGIIVKF